LRYAAALSIAIASHSVLDGMSASGTHVMFLWPFTTHRYLLPWTVFGVPRLPWPHSLIGRLERVAENEAVFGWIPSALLLIATAAIRRTKRATPLEGTGT
jgi:inner membrane protein